MDKILSETLKNEKARQEVVMNLCTEDNYISKDIIKLQGSLPKNNNEYIDTINKITSEYTCKLFKCKFANTLPYSISFANKIIYKATLEPDDVVLVMDSHFNDSVSFKNQDKRRFT